MLKLELPFHLTEPPQRSLPCSVGPADASKHAIVILTGLAISIDFHGRTYDVVSESPPRSDGLAHERMLWPYSLLRLSAKVSLEQQMMLPIRGNAAAISWRLAGNSVGPVKLRVTPIFTARAGLTSPGFQIESRTSGGRITWRPFPGCARIIGDTNGALQHRFVRLPGGTSPGSFHFHLSRRPSLLILCRETAPDARAIDPLIGSFLAQLNADRLAEQQHLRSLELAAA